MRALEEGQLAEVVAGVSHDGPWVKPEPEPFGLPVIRGPKVIVDDGAPI